jgi:hypothetical protein
VSESTRKIAAEAAQQIHKLGMTFSPWWFEQTEAIVESAIAIFQEDQRNRRVPNVPELNEVFDYGLSIGLTHDDCQDFIDHFSARGWCYAGGVVMKDHKGALRTWKKHKSRFQPTDDETSKPRYITSPAEQRARRRKEA